MKFLYEDTCLKKEKILIHVFVLSDENITLRYSILRCRQWVYFLWHCWRWLYWLRNWQWLRNLIACLHLRPNLYHRFIFNLDHAKLFVKTNIIIYRLFDFLIFFFFTKAWHARKTRCFMMKSFNHCLKRKNDYLVLCQQIYNH